MTTTRIGDVIRVYPFEKLRTSLAEATKAIRNADRTVVDDDAFAKLCDHQDELVGMLAARFPASGDEAIFLLHILRDRMVEDFTSDVISAANRDIVRGVTAYLSEATPVAADAQLLDLGITWKAARQAADTAPEGEVEPHYQRADECEDKAMDTPATTGAGVAVKLRMAMQGLLPDLNLDAPSGSGEKLFVAALRDAERIGGASC